MRRLLAALGLIAAMSDAFAGELALPTLRGSNNFVPEPPTYLRWSGFYAGGQVGLGTSGMDFSAATQSLIAFSLRETALENEAHPSTWQVLGKSNTRGSSFGGFVGYNTRFDDVILGLDFNYGRTSFFATAPISPIGRLTSAGGNTYDVTITGDASLRITDVGTLRARAGYAMGNFLPYFTIGMAAGQADFTRSATAFVQENGITIPPFTQGEARQNVFIYGWSIGAGIDMLVLSNVFVRGEFEYVGFGPVADIKAAMSTGRLGLGLKF